MSRVVVKYLNDCMTMRGYIQDILNEILCTNSQNPSLLKDYTVTEASMEYEDGPYVVTMERVILDGK